MDNDKFSNKTQIIFVRNTALAACLIAVGVRLRHDPPYVTKVEAGKKITEWYFRPVADDGTTRTIELIRAWKKDMEFIKAQPKHPMSIAMAALKNDANLKDHINKDKYFVTFTFGSTRMSVVEGSKKHKRCIAAGLKQI
jgi:hypothetical protein